jgi:DNA polymerase I-like protein with 3'-5' exonuclease and polymerase domains
MYRPPVIAFDYETALTNGVPSVEYYRGDFRAISCAFAWRGETGEIKTAYRVGETAVRAFLLRCEGVPMVAHNLHFEIGVTQCRFPDVQVEYHADTARLGQVADNGGPAGVNQGFSLAKTAIRWLPEDLHNHKEPYYSIIRSNGIKRGQEGSNLHLLDADQLEAYNVADAVVTLHLYETLTNQMKAIGYDWKFDHQLYLSSTRLLVGAKVRGVVVDRPLLETAISGYRNEVEQLELSFTGRFRSEIDTLEAEFREAKLARYKSPKGKAAADLSTCKFNVGSTKHLAKLFVDKLGIPAKFTTEKGSPAFGKAFLGSWGEGGKMLEKRRSLLIGEIQAKTLLEKSERDSIWHIDLKSVGTATGRFSGSGGLNAQGLKRKDKPLMSTMVARPGHTFVSVDLSAGEPTVTTHYSRDKYYRAASFDMVGKRPYWDGDVLMIDDIYIMTMSVSPLGRDKVRQWWADGMVDKWVADADGFKSSVKKDRQLHKVLCLGLGYGMGPKKLVSTAFAAGYDLDIATAKAFFKAYWKLFSGVKGLSERLAKEFTQKGYLVNDFGYRLVPDAEFKALNYMIQSSVSGIMHILCAKFFAVAPWAHFITVIHDEIIMEVPDDMLPAARLLMDEATESLNEDLNWSVNIRTGFVTGKNLYEAK